MNVYAIKAHQEQTEAYYVAAETPEEAIAWYRGSHFWPLSGEKPVYSVTVLVKLHGVRLTEEQGE